MAPLLGAGWDSIIFHHIPSYAIAITPEYQCFMMLHDASPWSQRLITPRRWSSPNPEGCLKANLAGGHRFCHLHPEKLDELNEPQKLQFQHVRFQRLRITKYPVDMHIFIRIHLHSFVLSIVIPFIYSHRHTEKSPKLRDETALQQGHSRIREGSSAQLPQ